MKYLLTSSLLALSLVACSPATDTTKTQKVTDVVTPLDAQKATLGEWGIALENMDKSVKPGDNFFKYVNGTWLKNTEIPADKSNYGMFTVLHDQSVKQVKAIIQDMAKEKAAAGSVEQKIGDLYAAYMDQDQIEENGLKPVQADLATIKALKTHSDIAAAMGNPALGLESPVSSYVWIDAKDPESYITYIGQSGLGMPNRDYYLDDDAKSVEVRKKYVAFLAQMLDFAGADNVDARANAIMAFETSMAKAHWTKEKSRNRDLTYNKMSMDELKTYAPGYDWTEMANAAGLGDVKDVVVSQNTAVKELATIFEKTPASVLQDYMTAHYLSDMAPYLPKAIDEANFDFYGKTLRGTKQQRERWKRGVGIVSGSLGEAIGQVYVKRHFQPRAKQEMDILVENLRAAFRDGLDNLEWMSEDTKKEAQYKLAKFYPKIGYPKKWKDYSALKVDRNDLIGTVKSGNEWSWKENIARLGSEIDREEWFMTPQTVNAYYNPSMNEIVFPAAILQAPFFDPNADPAVNYGGIGAVIGHEMGHGFDDQGSKSDGDGKQRDWWSESDREAFEARTGELIKQYDQFEALPGLHVNGEFTQGENIGDLTGLTMGYAAYKRSLNGKEAPIIDGLTGDQRFFLAYAQIWARKFRDEELHNRIKTDPHSPGEFRANGIVRNFDAWYEAFNIQPGDAMYLPPEKRVKIW